LARVLLVEDESNLRMLYRMELQAEGNEIIEAASGAEAAHVLRHDQALDAMILDLNLPDIAGWQLLNWVASSRPQLPVIINTAYADFRDDYRGWHAQAYVVKSSDLTPLKTALARCLAAAARREHENAIEFKRGRFQ